MVRKLLSDLQRLESRTWSLSRAQRVNAALYAFALLGLGLIALEVRQTEAPSREVRSVSGPVTTASRDQPVVSPGDRRLVEGSGAVPSPAVEPNAAGTATTSSGSAPAGRTTSDGSTSGVAIPTPAAPPAVGPPALESLGVNVVTASPWPAPVDMAPALSGGTGSLPAMSLVPDPPPLPALPPPTSSRSATGVGGPAPADPILANPPVPRFSGPAFDGRAQPAS